MFLLESATPRGVYIIFPPLNHAGTTCKKPYRTTRVAFIMICLSHWQSSGHYQHHHCEDNGRCGALADESGVQLSEEILKAGNCFTRVFNMGSAMHRKFKKNMEEYEKTYNDLLEKMKKDRLSEIGRCCCHVMFATAATFLFECHANSNGLQLLPGHRQS